MVLAALGYGVHAVAVHLQEGPVVRVLTAAAVAVQKQAMAARAAPSKELSPAQDLGAAVSKVERVHLLSSSANGDGDVEAVVSVWGEAGSSPFSPQLQRGMTCLRVVATPGQSMEGYGSRGNVAVSSVSCPPVVPLGPAPDGEQPAPGSLPQVSVSIPDAIVSAGYAGCISGSTCN